MAMFIYHPVISQDYLHVYQVVAFAHNVSYSGLLHPFWGMRPLELGKLPTLTGIGKIITQFCEVFFFFSQKRRHIETSKTQNIIQNCLRDNLNHSLVQMLASCKNISVRLMTFEQSSNTWLNCDFVFWNWGKKVLFGIVNGA